MTTEQHKETASQKYRRKLKENPELHADYLRRERARDSKRREVTKRKMETDVDLRILARIRSKERMQATRKRRKEEQVKQTSTRYSSPRTLGKAVAKVKRNLPASPTKAVEVVKKIASEFHIAVFDKNDAPKAAPRKLTDEGKKLICDFYNRDDISRQMPGIKDVKTVKSNTGTKTRVQKRTMIMSIREAFEIFKETHPEMSMGKTVFYNERPAHILPINDTPHNVCVCTTHSNYINLLLAISKHATDFPKTHQELLRQVSCSVDNEDCMSSSCDACKESNIWDITLDSNPCVNWKAWIFQNQRPKQVVISKPFNEALDELHDSTGKFKLHSFVKNVQSDYFQNAKQDLTSEKAVVQIDFAENYALISQDEIQSAHWSHAQVTLFTCCIWTTNKLHSLVIVSDELSHNKYTVHLFLQKIFEYIKSVSDNITFLSIFSDNCAAQFKNRYVMASMNALKAEYGFNHLEWNFFAASHGKGAVDGIGGSVKRSVWIAVKSRKAIVNSALEFYDLARDLSKNIIFKFVAKEEVKEKIAMLDDEWEGLKNIPGIQSKHFFQFGEAGSISVARTSLSHFKCTLVLKSPKTTTNTESDWADDDLEPLTNHKLLKEIPCPDNISVPSVSDQRKSVLPLKKRLRVSDVYSDSDTDSDNEFINDETPSTSFQGSKLSPEACPEIATVQAAVLPKDICAGLYVLVQLLCKTGKRITQYRYVGLCQSDMDEDGEIRVQFMTTIDGKRFTEIVNDIADVPFDDIIAKLEVPEKKTNNGNTFIEFSAEIDVFEKK